jgi:tRNA 2-thiouridine synthesizing protein E
MDGLMQKSNNSFHTKDGFLIHYIDWSKDFAIKAAKDEGITLTKDHWLIINFLREYFSKNMKSPAIRLLVKSLKENYGTEKGNSLYLQSLFPESPAVQAAKIAGLPRPKKCI